jgi:solute carrier family 25 folate transporter 32
MLHASALAGACAGLVSSIVTCPLDVVKTRLQAQGGPSKPLQHGWSGPGGHPNGAIGGGAAREAWERSLKLQAAKEGVSVEAVENRPLGLTGIVRGIWAKDGVRGFYRGLGPTIFGYLPTWAIYFTVYDQCKALLADSMNDSGDGDFFNHILSALTAGALSTCCTSPLWVVKTRFMLQSVKDPRTKPYRHTGDAFVQIFKTEGIRGFYRGLLPSLFGVSHVAVQFPLYEKFKSWAREEGADDISPSVILTCSSSAKMIASVLTYPHEVLRTRLQMQPKITAPVAASDIPKSQQQQHRSIHTGIIGKLGQNSTRGGGGSMASTLTSLDRRRRGISHMGNVNSGNRYTGVLQACTTIAREEGLRGFYRGMGVNLIRTVPSSALTILT